MFIQIYRKGSIPFNFSTFSTIIFSLNPKQCSLESLICFGLFLLVTSLSPAQMMPKPDQAPDRTLIISGGGSRVAWAAGFAKALSESGKSYKTVGGTSAGALIMSSVALNQFDELERLFDTISNSNVYNKNPINKKGRIKVFKTIWRTIWGKSSVGENKSLRKTLESIFSPLDYLKIQEQQKTVFCLATSLNTSNKIIKSSDNTSYRDLLDWIWASASVPVLTAPVEKDGQSWVDGGLLDNVPIDEGLFDNPKEIDVIVLFPEEKPYWESQLKIPRISLRAINIMVYESFRGSIQLGKLMAQMKKGGRLNIYYMSKDDADFIGNVYSFDKKILSPSFKKGYHAFFNKTMTLRTYIIDGLGNIVQE